MSLMFTEFYLNIELIDKTHTSPTSVFLSVIYNLNLDKSKGLIIVLAMTLTLFGAHQIADTVWGASNTFTSGRAISVLVSTK